MQRLESTGAQHRSCHLLWNGFTYKWNKAPHRLAILGSRFNNWYLEKEGISAYHDHFLKIGNWPPDSATYHAPITAIATREIFIGTGRRNDVVVSGKLGHECRKEVEVHVKLADLLSTYDYAKLAAARDSQVTVLLNGFKIEADNNRSGWHFRGLGIEVKGATWKGKDGVKFKANFFTHPDLNPDPIYHGNKKPEGDKWRREDPCKYRFSIDYTILIGSPDKIDTDEKQIEHEVTRKKRTRIEEEVSFAHDYSRFPAVFAGMNGFEFHVNNHGKKKGASGRYIKEMAAYLSDFVEDKKGNTFSCQGNLAFSNGGITAFRWDLNARLSFSKIGLAGKSQVKHGELNGATSGKAVMTSQRIESKFA